MALPGGRKIIVDSRNYEWICKNKRRPYDNFDDYGNPIESYDKEITIRVDEDGGKLTQHRINRSAITPEFVAELIRVDVSRGSL